MARNEHIYGIHAVDHFIETSPERVLSAFVLDGRSNRRLENVIDKLSVCGCHIQTLTKTQLDKLCEGGRHQGVVIEIRGTLSLPEDALDELLADVNDGTLVVILDGVQDPRNLGACLRVADGAGVTAVIAPKNRAAGLTTSAKKVASGAAVPFIQVTNLARTLRDLQSRGIWLVGTSDAAEDSLFSVNLTGPIGLVLGGEESGIRRLTRDTCDSLISIPMKGRVDSLNVSVATGIVLFEAVRQRQSS